MFVIAGNRGIVMGRVENGQPIFQQLQNSRGEPLSLGWSESGLGAAINDSGQFVVAGNRGVHTGSFPSR